MNEAVVLLAALFGAIIGWYYCWNYSWLPEMKKRTMVIRQHENFIQENNLNILWH